MEKNQKDVRKPTPRVHGMTDHRLASMYKEVVTDWGYNFKPPTFGEWARIVQKVASRGRI